MRIYTTLSGDAAAPHTGIRVTYRWKDLCRSWCSTFELLIMSACVCGGVFALCWAEHKDIYLWDLFYWLVFKVARLWAAFPLFENMLQLAVSQRCIHLCRRLNYNPLIHLKSERSSGMLRRDNCQASLQTPSAPSTPQGERGRRREERGMNLGMFADRTRSCGGGGGDNMWHHSESWALRHGAFVARSQPDVPSVSKQEWLCEGNFQQFVRF